MFLASSPLFSDVDVAMKRAPNSICACQSVFQEMSPNGRRGLGQRSQIPIRGRGVSSPLPFLHFKALVPVPSLTSRHGSRTSVDSDHAESENAGVQL